MDAPKLETAIRGAENMIHEAVQGQALVDDWVVQPAQYLAPTLTRGGLTLAEWHRKVTFLHQPHA